jgi:hypothetical protein
LIEPVNVHYSSPSLENRRGLTCSVRAQEPEPVLGQAQGLVRELPALGWGFQAVLVLPWESPAYRSTVQWSARVPELERA